MTAAGARQETKQRLAAGVQALRTQAQRQQTFYQDLGQLTQHWLLKASPAGSPAPFFVELRAGRRRLGTAVSNPAPGV